MNLPQAAKSIIPILSHQLKARLLHKDQKSIHNRASCKITITLEIKVRNLVENNLIHRRKAKKNHSLSVIAIHSRKYSYSLDKIFGTLLVFVVVKKGIALKHAHLFTNLKDA